jgi:hypothetical protein
MHGRFLIIFAVMGLIAFGFAARSVAEDAKEPQQVRPTQQASPAVPLPSDLEPSVTVLGSRQAQGVMGREVRSSADENMGRIVDIIVDRAGQVRAAIIDFGGFLGVGSRKIAVDWDALRFPLVNAKQDAILLELTRDQVKAAPEYRDKQPVVVLGASGGLQSLPVD